ncbi:DNA repair protein endonuclease SAE2/CtIP C-terminus-domain-containing protein [Pyrenochaeta sp. MPI-SDFR-AT-0127]|nr:DNA repair protein endonuclease SAE2/CtIP C-terminus-domain-containing protein [Pyrenochaeta sp. MPI-SDFR-AT-0127]
MAEFAAWVEKNKALWTRVYDEVIAPDFEQEWKKREEQHTKVLQQKDEHQQILFRHISNEAVKYEHLTTENAQLKEQLQTHFGISEATSKHEKVDARESSVPAEEHRHLTDRFNELNKKYHDVSQKVRYLERKNNVVMQKNKDMKDSVRAWQEYADRQSGKQKLKGERRPEDEEPRLSAVHPLHDDRPRFPSSPRSVATVRTPQSPLDLERSSLAPMAPPQRLETATLNQAVSADPITRDEAMNPNAAVTPKPMSPDAHNKQQNRYLHDPSMTLSSHDAISLPENERHAQTHLRITNPSSSQTTEDEIAEQGVQQRAWDEGDEGDVPQFVSERSLKRKRGQYSKARFEIFADRSSDGTPSKPFRVKEEPPSSPPITASNLLRTETFDLDEPAPNVLQTPRHARRKPLSHSNMTGILRHQRSNSAPFTQAIKKEDNQVGADFTDPQVKFDELQIAITEGRAISEPTDPLQTESTVLRPLDLNTLTNISKEAANKRAGHAEGGQKQGYHMLAESGEVSPPSDEDQFRLPPHLARAEFNRRLQDSKSPQSPAKRLRRTPRLESATIKREQIPTPPSSSALATHTLTSGAGGHSKALKFSSNLLDTPPLDDRPIWTLNGSKPTVRKARTSPQKEQGRLRTKPYTELNIKDFKPNPAYNQGYSYAFSETVRKRGDRMCLPGCTNPQCCGSTFRTFAEAQAPLSASQEEVLLEDYLGDAYNSMHLTQMSSDERQELVLQARTKRMAKETGKHREAYERRRTPPGFWRVDFPTTQEQQEDKDRAKELEKTIVQGRWLEAQQKGGRWIFRDE